MNNSIEVNSKTEDYMPCLVDWYKSSCRNGEHVFIWSATSASEEAPEGMKCSCGMVKAYYEDCPCCGARILKQRLVD